MIKYPPIFLLFFAAFFAQGQAVSEDKIYSTYDQLVGLDNSGLYNGTEFIDSYPNTDGTYRFLEGFDYTKGSVLYKGQYYVDVLLKYDLLDDQLLTKSDDNLSVFNVKLIREFVSEFTLSGRHFVKLQDWDKNGFFEQGYKGRIINLYIKHKKKQQKKVLKSGIQYRYKPVTYYLIEYQGKYVQFESLRNLRREFPELKAEINSFYHSNKFLYKENRDVFMKKVAAYLDNLSPINKS